MPVRLLKPQLRTSRKWNSVTLFDQSTYIRLITVADDYGRYYGHPRLLASELWPLGGERGEDVTGAQMETALHNLENAKLISLYKQEGETFVQIENWQERVRAHGSKFPKKNTDCLADAGQMPVRCLADAGQMLASPPTPTPTPTPAPAPVGEQMRARALDGDGDASIPTQEEVLAEASMRGVSRDSALKFFNHHHGNALWINATGRLINWRHKLRSWAESDRQGAGMPASVRKPSNGPSLREVQAYEKEKGGDGVYACSWWRHWEDKQWIKDGRVIDWQVVFSAAFAKRKDSI